MLEGLWIFIWNLSNCDGGDYDAIAARVKQAGAAGVLVKASDGTNWFPQYQAAGGAPPFAVPALHRPGVAHISPELQAAGAIVPVSTIVQELKARGVGVGTWSYHYGADPQGEATLVRQTLDLAQPDVHVDDVEQEFEDRSDPATQATALIAATGAGPLAYCPLPVIDLHVRLPYRQFTDAGYPMVPMLYWTAFAWTPQYTVQRFYQGVAAYSLGQQPIAPAYMDAPQAGLPATSADVAAFCQAIKDQGAVGASTWSYEHMDAAAWGRAAIVAGFFAPPAPPLPDLQQQLDQANQEITALQAKIAQAVVDLQS